jgi:hypothetical protein
MIFAVIVVRRRRRRYSLGRNGLNERRLGGQPRIAH